MKVNYSNQPPIKDHYSIFLAGPTPRKIDVPSWRPDALKVLEGIGFQGTVYVPEHDPKLPPAYDYLEQVEWEYTCLEGAGAICFWIPRKLPDMPAFTTNVEFGRYVGSGRIFYGRPAWAEKKGYLDWLYGKVTGKTPCADMEQLFTQTIAWLEEYDRMRKMVDDFERWADDLVRS